MKEMNKTYNPQDIEKNRYQTWEEAGYFKPIPHSEKGTFCIMIPPPNVTGSLHMGHGFQHTLMDTLIRYQRMLGKKVLWKVGTDHAGIATQMVVERQLQASNISRHDLGREEFIQRIWAWKQQSGNQITQQLRRMGNSVDWSQERFTMDNDYCKAVQEVFVRLHEEDLIYRGKRLVNWDPKLRTAISDLEVVTQEEPGYMWHIRYFLADSADYLVVATTRPETLFGDVAVAVHPEDSRYQAYIGRLLKLPCTDRLIPVIADNYVDPTFGSGCVKITPAHDFNDYAVGQRHQLDLINIFTPTAHLNDQVPHEYQNLERFEARKKLLLDLKNQDLIEKTEDHVLKIPRGDRSGVVIEPYLTDQWFVKTESLAKPAINVVEEGKIRFIPENWTETYYQWMNNIQDWCISRQLWWGHRIPAWYDQDGNSYVGHSEIEVRQKYVLSSSVILQQDNDVLDTWFSSALWPFATLGWPEKTAELATYYPTSVLVTGFDIIFFWVARMIMMGLKFADHIPFEKIYITGLIRDHEGHKMSKTKGNVLDPIDLIDGIDLESLIKKRTAELIQPQAAERVEQITRQQFPQGIPPYGTDALRFTFCALASTGRDIRFDMGRLEGYRNFCNKLWNATRFVLMNIGENFQPQSIEQNSPNLPDCWILARLQETIAQVRGHLDHYRFDLTANCLYEFIWNEYCDWYLELTKPILNSGTETEQQATRWTLLTVLETILRLLHPLMPFITEELWQQIAPLIGKSLAENPTIMLQSYPEAKSMSATDKAAITEINWLKSVIIAFRTRRSERNIPPGKKITVAFYEIIPGTKKRIENLTHFLQPIARIDEIKFLAEQQTQMIGNIIFDGAEAYLLNEADDVQKEKERLQKEITKLDKEIIYVQSKLNNPKFLEKANPIEVDKQRKLLNERTAEMDRLKLEMQMC